MEKPKICVSITGVIKAEEELDNIMRKYYESDIKQYADLAERKRIEECEREKIAEERRKKF